MNRQQIEYIRQRIDELRKCLDGMTGPEAEHVRKRIDELEQALDSAALHWIPKNLK